MSTLCDYIYASFVDREAAVSGLAHMLATGELRESEHPRVELCLGRWRITLTIPDDYEG